MKNNSLLKIIKEIFDFILSNDRFCKIFQRDDFSYRLEELLSISKSLCSKNNIKFNYLQYLLSFNIMFNIRIKIDEDFTYDEVLFKDVIEDNKLYFERIFKESSDKNVDIKSHLSSGRTRWSFPMDQPWSFFYNTYCGGFEILSDRNINEKALNLIRKDFSDNKVSFYNKKYQQYFFLKILFIIISFLICSFALSVLITSSLNNWKESELVVILCICSYVFFMLNMVCTIYQLIRYKNYRFHIPIVFIPDGHTFTKAMSRVRHDWYLFLFWGLIIVFVANFVIELTLIKNEDIWFIICASILFISVVPYTMLVLYLNYKKTDINYNLIINLYDKYYEQISSEINIDKVQ